MSGNDQIWETFEPEVAAAVQAALPVGWRASIIAVSDSPSGAVLRVTATSGESADFVVETCLLMASTGYTAMSASAKRDGRAGLVVLAPYLSAPFRAELEKLAVSYADATGWVRLVSDRPMLAVTAIGADRAPRTASRRQTLSLKGASAGRIVSTLLSNDLPVGVRELAEAAGVSPGTVSKTLPLLTAEDAVTRDPDGKITAVDRRRVLDRWTLDYHVLTSNPDVEYFVAPRGLDQARAMLTGRTDIALTGSQAARAYLPDSVSLLVPATQIVCYTADVPTMAARLGLVEVNPPSANTILIRPQDSTLLEDPPIADGLPVAPLPLVLADLLTLPGRYPQQAAALMDSLAKTDPAWRAR